MTETREFPTVVIASISSGTLLCEFSKFHEAAEFLMGCPIWRHQFANKGLFDEMKMAVAEQCPGMPMDHIDGITAANYREKVAALEAELGPTVRVCRGRGLTIRHLMDDIPADKPVIVVQPKPSN